MGQTSESAPARPVILIVDDDLAVRGSLKFSLEIDGFSVRDYRSGEDLLQEVPFPGAGCLVVDYKLPGMNGLDLVAELRHRQVVLPIILITTHPSASIRARAASAGVPVIEKPLLGESLFHGIRAALSR